MACAEELIWLSANRDHMPARAARRSGSRVAGEIASADHPAGREHVKVMHLLYSMEYGGAQKIIEQYLALLNHAEFSQTVCALGGEGPMVRTYQSLGAKVHCLAKRQGPDPVLIFRLARLLRKERIELLHLHDHSSSFYGALASLLARTPHRIRTLHAVFVPEQESQVYKYINPFLHVFLERIVAVSDRVAESHRRLDSLNRSKYVTIWNGVPTRQSVPNEARSRLMGELGLQPTDRVIGFIGRLALPKGVPYLVEAAAEICAEEPASRVVIVGEGEIGSSLRRQADETGLGDRILFTGRRSDIPELLSTMEIFIMPSNWEALPQALLEAMEAARPVIATSVGGIPDVIKPEVNGLLIPPRDPKAIARAVIRLMRDKKLATRIGAAARETVRKRFSVEQLIRSTEKVYREVLNG